MNRRGVLGMVGLFLLSVCAYSGFQWLGMTHSYLMRFTDPATQTADSFIIAERVVGVRWGVVYGFSWRLISRLLREAPGTVSKVSDWGIVYPGMMPYETTFGFSLRGEDRLYIGHGPYGEGQWSFPIWPLAVAFLIPELRSRWKRHRERRASWSNTCRACG